MFFLSPYPPGSSFHPTGYVENIDGGGHYSKERMQLGGKIHPDDRFKNPIAEEPLRILVRGA